MRHSGTGVMRVRPLRVVFVALSLSIGLWCLFALPARARAQSAPDLPDVLKRSMAQYPNLKSYADTGTVLVERNGLVDRAKFRTYFRRPTDLYFEFSDHVSTSANLPIKMPTHVVVWMLKGELESWNGASKAHELVPRESGNQVNALISASISSQGAATLIPSMIFAQSRIVGPMQEMFQATLAGEEMVGGRKSHKVTGVARSVYPATGAVTNIRPITIWIDAESLLIRKVFEDTPKGYPAGSFVRKTVTYEPQANLPLDDARFRFTVPAR